MSDVEKQQPEHPLETVRASPLVGVVGAEPLAAPLVGVVGAAPLTVPLEEDILKKIINIYKKYK